jgi:two-component system, NarL family, nitrate/nitrite response regulator NarL
MEAEPKPRVSIFIGDHLVRECLSEALGGSGASVVGAFAAPEPFLEQLGREPPDLALVEVRQEGEPDPNFLGVARRRGPGVPLLAVAWPVSELFADQLLQNGATAVLDGSRHGLETLLAQIRALSGRSMPGPRRVRNDLAARQVDSRALSGLSARERQVLAYVAAGMDNLKIAAHLGLCERTVKTHVSSLYRKLAQENRIQLVLFAQRLGIDSPEDL